MRCLVTGHKGYIGAHLLKKLRSLGHQVVGVDFANDPQQNLLYCLENNPHYISFRPEYIFHLACIPRVGYSVEEPVLTMQNNVISTTKVLDFAKKVKAKRVVYSGSSSVVGDGSGPNSPYGLQKLVSENKNPFITGDGEQRRDMANVKDVVSANIFAMEYEENFNGRYFDIGTGDNISMNEIAQIVKKHFPKVEFSYVEPRKGDVLYTKADMSPIEKFGWKPQIEITKGVEECFEKLKNEIKE